VAKGVPHYLKDGTLHKGGLHKMPNGELHSGAAHTDKSKKLFHKKELPKSVQLKIKEKPSGKKRVTKKSK
tara:strand:- start:65 stop:274 length:210 start_codon:yes stop_codon:yes gene_type:complete